MSVCDRSWEDRCITWSRRIRKMHNGRTNPSHEGELQNLWMQGMVISSMLATPKINMFFTHA